MTSYEALLPQVFPWRTEVRQAVADEIARMLISPAQSIPSGSSFAVCSNASRPGLRVMWLSAVSLERLQESGKFPRVAWQHETRGE